jgi:hypothetical protein
MMSCKTRSKSKRAFVSKDTDGKQLAPVKKKATCRESSKERRRVSGKERRRN